MTELTLHVVVGQQEGLACFWTAMAAGVKVQYKWTTEEHHTRTAERLSLTDRHHGPILETEHGILTEASAIMRYLANRAESGNLAGSSLFHRAQVDQWMAHVRRCSAHTFDHKAGRQGAVALDSSEVESMDSKLIAAMKHVEAQLAKNKFLAGDSMSLADLYLASVWYGTSRGPVLIDTVHKQLPHMHKWWKEVSSQSWFTKTFGRSWELRREFAMADASAIAGNNKKLEFSLGSVNKKGKKADKKGKKADKTADKSAKSPAKSPKKSPKKSPQKAPGAKKVEAEDDFDLFGDETEEDKQAAEDLKKKQEEAAKKKKNKPAPIAKSQVVFDVKGYEVGYDWESMAAKIRAEIQMDGLVWMDTHKVLEIAFGMKKLQMTMVIEDEKVSSEDVMEKIEAWEDDVQSTDIVSFNKA